MSLSTLMAESYSGAEQASKPRRAVHSKVIYMLPRWR